MRRLYNYFGDIETAYNSKLSDLEQIEGLSVRRAENFIEKRKGVNPDKTLDDILSRGIKILTYLFTDISISIVRLKINIFLKIKLTNYFCQI